MDMTHWDAAEVELLISLATSGLRWDTIGIRMCKLPKVCRYKWNEIANQQNRQEREDARYHYQLTGEPVIRPRLAPGETGFPVGMRFGEERIVEYGRVALRPTFVRSVSTMASVGSTQHSGHNRRPAGARPTG